MKNASTLLLKFELPPHQGTKGTPTEEAALKQKKKNNSHSVFDPTKHLAFILAVQLFIYAFDSDRSSMCSDLFFISLYSFKIS